MNILEPKIRKDYINNELVENKSEISYINRLIDILWEKPKIVYLIIKNSEMNELKQYLAPLFVDTF